MFEIYVCIYIFLLCLISLNQSEDSVRFSTSFLDDKPVVLCVRDMYEQKRWRRIIINDDYLVDEQLVSVPSTF